MTGSTAPSIESRPDKHRIFFALWPEPQQAAVLHHLAETLVGQTGGRCMAEDTLHLTLAFPGNVSTMQLAAAIAVAEQIRGKSFDLSVDTLGYWPHNQILWAGCRQAPPALLSLAEQLQTKLRAAGLNIEARPFTPHITLLRHCANDAAPHPPLAMTWAAKAFVLVASAPDAGKARYRMIGRWPLVP